MPIFLPPTMLSATPPGPATHAYVGEVTSTTDAASYTFTGAAIGTPNAKRVVVLCLGGESGSSAATVSGVTIGGVAATKIVEDQNTASGAYTTASIFAASIPTGTNADIVVTYTATRVNCQCAVYNVITTTPGAAFTNVSHPASSPDVPSVNCPAGGVIIACATNGNYGATTWTATGMTKDYDYVIETYYTFSSASGEFATAQAPEAISVTNANWFGMASCAASWGG